MSYWAQNWQLWLSAFCVIAIYSYLYKDNPLYRTMVQVFIGIQVGYNVIVQWRDILYPNWWLPMLDGFDALFFGGTGSPWGSMWAFVGLLGLLWYFQMSRKYLWLSRIVIGVVIGIGAGITFKTQIGTNLPQLTDTFRPLAPAVVGPQPVELFKLPPATISPAIDGELGFFVSEREVACVELLNGAVLWTATASMDPTGSDVSENIFSIRGEGKDVEVFDRETGRSHIPESRGTISRLSEPLVPQRSFPDRDKLPADLGFNIYSIEGTGISIWRDKTHLTGYDSFASRLLWRVPFEAQHLRFSGVTMLAAKGGRLWSIDLQTGERGFQLDLPADIVAAPVIAQMKEPTEDEVYAVVPLTDGRLVAVVIAKHLGLNREAGEVLWMSDAGRPITHITALEGVATLSGPAGGRMVELPRPTKKLVWTDYVNNWIFVFTVIAVMTYFFFSFKQTAKPVQWTATYGRWMLMIAFGAFFGNTVMTRMSYLLDRLMFLIDEWLRPVFS